MCRLIVLLKDCQSPVAAGSIFESTERFSVWVFFMGLALHEYWSAGLCMCGWSAQNENRELWKLGTLPPGLITFYKTTKPLDKSWHVLGLGYNPNISLDKIKQAAVIHYNGNMKPWLDLAMNQYRDFWTKYVDYDQEFVQQCNFGLWEGVTLICETGHYMTDS